MVSAAWAETGTLAIAEEALELLGIMAEPSGASTHFHAWASVAWLKRRAGLMDYSKRKEDAKPIKSRLPDQVERNAAHLRMYGPGGVQRQTLIRHLLGLLLRSQYDDVPVKSPRGPAAEGGVRECVVRLERTMSGDVYRRKGRAGSLVSRGANREFGTKYV
ncbi:hypothetical protein LTR56_008685 [Elasticomyces elasticus]|nr:hypothetical protein LTR56_008685 [Elasticomyces elasticus]KAK4924249.1 hypothetical protein LTR49_008549 [Elasticomyces elasticus]